MLTKRAKLIIIVVQIVLQITINKGGKMKVKDLIKELKEVPNQNARVDLMIPADLGHDTIDDFCTSEFYVDSIHAQHQDEVEYIEIYSIKELGE